MAEPTKKFRVSCTVSYRRTWTNIEAETAEEAARMCFDDDAGEADENELYRGPEGPDDMETEELPNA